VTDKAGARREYVLGLALGAAGAALVLLAVRQDWAHVVTPAPAPLPATSVFVRGQDLVPVAGALGLAALAGLAAVVATRGIARRLTGLLLAAFGLAMMVSVGVRTTTSSVLAAARAAGVPEAGSATAGGVSGVAPGTVPGGAAPGVTATGHVMLAGFPWQAVALAGALIVLAAGVLTAWRGPGWPSMSSRYERAGRAAPTDAAAPRGAANGSAAMWDALSRGADPTDRPAGNAPAANPPAANPPAAQAPAADSGGKAADVPG
jgi:uncharacterized membrane protein (TIGR02234 family)